MSIRYLPHREIDFAKWDACIEAAPNGMTYAHSWYLDVVAERKWDVLVEGDYESVFPLPWNQKFLLFKQLYQPFFTQQLGLFSKKVVTPSLLQAFLQAIPMKFKRVHILLNEGCFEAASELPGISKRVNMVLQLSVSYETIAAGYSRNLRRNLRDAHSAGLYMKENISPEALITFYKKQVGEKVEDLKSSDYEQLRRLIIAALERKKGKIFGVFNPANTLLGVGFFLFDERRIINLFGCPSPEGREVGATQFMLDYLIAGHAGREKMIFDFEGSMIPAVADFFRRFGAEERWIPVIQR